ncbi:MAG TPA: lipid II flippase MurJ [Actinomycetes bacterium]|nr:lipid II flippase MurJ [Actinomycetes bacterium]
MNAAAGQAPTPDSRSGLPPWASAALLIAGVTLVARIIGFVRYIVLSHTVGPTCLGDVYATANSVPNIVYEVVVGGALVAVVVPLVAGARESDPERVRATVAALHGWALTLLVPITLVMYLVSPLVIDVLLGASPTCPDDAATVATQMLWVFLLQIPVYGATVVAQGALQSHHRFGAPAVAPAVSSLLVIGSYLLYDSMAGDAHGSLVALTTAQFWVLAGGTTLGVFALLLVQIPSLVRAGLIVRPSLRFTSDEGARRARTLAWSGGVVVACQWLAYAAAIRWSNVYGGVGSALVFVLAWTLFLLPWSVLALPIATSTFPRLSALHARKDVDGVARATSISLRAVVVASAAGAAAVAAAAQPLASVMVEDVPGSDPVPELAAILVALSPGVLAYGVHGHLVRVLAAGHQAPRAAAGTAAGWLVGIAVAWAGVRAADDATTVAAAIGIGFSTGLVVAAFALVALVARLEGRRALNHVPLTTLAVCGAALVVGWAGHLVIGEQADGVTIGVAIAQVVAVGALALLVVGATAFVVDRSSARTLMRMLSRSSSAADD